MISLIAGGVLTLYQWISMYWFYKWAKNNLAIFKKIKSERKKGRKEQSESGFLDTKAEKIEKKDNTLGSDGDADEAQRVPCQDMDGDCI